MIPNLGFLSGVLAALRAVGGSSMAAMSVREVIRR